MLPLLNLVLISIVTYHDVIKQLHLLVTYYVPDTTLNGVVCYHFEEGTIIIPILQVRKLRHRRIL